MLGQGESSPDTGTGTQGSPVMHNEPGYALHQLSQMQLLQQHQQAMAQHAAHAAYGTRAHSGLGGLFGQQSGLCEGGAPQPAFYSGMPDLMGHQGAGLLDPTGSLSHIDLSMLSNPTADLPVGSQPAGFQQQMSSQLGRDVDLQGVKTEQPHGHSPFMHSRPGSTAPSGGGVTHPEVGDIIGDGDVDHSAIISHFKEYANKVGFVMTRNFDNLDAAGRYRRVRVACKQGGMPRKTPRHENPALQRERTSQKVGCPFEVTVWRTKQRPGGVQAAEERWVITNVKGITHGPCPLLGNVCHPLSKAQDGIHKDAQDQIKAQIKRTQLAAQHLKRSAAALEPDALKMVRPLAPSAPRSPAGPHHPATASAPL